MPAAENRISSTQRLHLLAVARQAIREHVLHQRLPEPAARAEATGKRGAFVTLRRERRLRGCMGRVDSMEPLETLVAVCAVLAASSDPRFTPIGAEELDLLEIELSILCAPQLVSAAAAIQTIIPGVHGIVIALSASRGLLLPQVALEQGWSAERFLQETCRKAGLRADAWRDPQARIELFTAEVFAESKEAAGG